MDALKEGLFNADPGLLPRILIIDHHDSYTLNLLISITHASKCTSTQITSRIIVLSHNHKYLATVSLFKQHLLPHFDALILGPGPGHPSKEEDFGSAQRILDASLKGDVVIPILGICLGHQGIATACGGNVIQANSLRHGLISEIHFERQSPGEVTLPTLFDAFIDRASTSGRAEMIRYNSLTVDEASES
jgi:para-aminobenzoate synthetase